MYILSIVISFSAGASLSIINNNYAPMNSNRQNFLNIETSIDNKASLNFQSQERFGEKSENTDNNSKETAFSCKFGNHVNRYRTEKSSPQDCVSLSWTFRSAPLSTPLLIFEKIRARKFAWP